MDNNKTQIDKYVGIPNDDVDLTSTILSANAIKSHLHVITMRVGALINNYRKKNNLTIANLAEKSHVSSTVITDLENARSIPRIEVLLKLMYALDIPYTLFFKEFIPSSFTWCSNVSRRAEKNMANKYRIMKADISSTGQEKLDYLLKLDGFGPLDIKDIKEYIEFKKFRNSKRK